MPLDKLPKSFGFKEKKKGFFPHFFNTKENENAVLPSLPDIHYYDPDSMSKERRSEFLIWYEECEGLKHPLESFSQIDHAVIVMSNNY